MRNPLPADGLGGQRMTNRKVRSDGLKPYSIAFSIAGLPKTPNQLLGAHWTIRSGHAKKWKRAVFRAVILNGGPPKAPLNKSLITCTRYSSGRMDREGLCGSFKAPIDALKTSGVIVDDSPEHVTIDYVHEKAPPGKGSISIRVEEVS